MLCHKMGDIKVYHEKQVKELCALHALNNLFQSQEAFTKGYLDSLCYKLSPDHWINPHKSILGLGNYDVNVIMKALQSKGYEAVWFDKRKDLCHLNLKKIFGFILNVPTEYKFSFITLPLSRKHWIAIRDLNGNYYNLDSKLTKPQIIGCETEVLDYLKSEVDNKDRELFIVVPTEVDQDQSWLLDKSTYLENVVGREAEVVILKDIGVTENDIFDNR